MIVLQKVSSCGVTPDPTLTKDISFGEQGKTKEKRQKEREEEEEEEVTDVFPSENDHTCYLTVFI